MPKQTKEDILIRARELFNKHGYNRVSMRNIADDLGISVGNLTYHFKKKEELMEEVVGYKHSKYKKPIPPKSLEELNKLFLNRLSGQSEDAYYFDNFHQLSQISLKVKNFQLEVLKDFHEVLKESFVYLKGLGLIREDVMLGQIDNIIQCILTILIYGPINANELNESESRENTINCLWSIIFMYLTDKGKKVYIDSIACNS